MSDSNGKNDYENKMRELINDKHNHLATTFSKLGTELLKDSEKPNILTFAEFEPYIPIYKIDNDLYKKNENYRLETNRLYNKFCRTFDINWFQPIIVIQSRENPVELYFLDRRFTRIKSDQVDGDAFRDNVPGALPRSSNVTREDLLMSASIRDINLANSTEKQIDYFKKVRVNSAYLKKQFVEKNLNPELRNKEIGNVESNIVPTSQIDVHIEMDDDE